MKVITWNLGYASITSPSINNQEIVNSALKYIEDKADIVLAQEMYIPEGVEEGAVCKFNDIYQYCIFKSIPKNRPEGSQWGGKEGNDIKNQNDSKKWGTAIFSKTMIDPIQLEVNTSYPGTIVIAKSTLYNTAFISMYGKAIRYGSNNNYIHNLHRSISDLFPILSTPLLEKNFDLKNVIIAGDWNIGPEFDDQTTRRYSNFFERMYDLGAYDCLGNFPNGTYQATFKDGSKQIDRMLANKELIQKIVTSQIDSSEKRFQYSDHCHICTEFDI